MYMRNCDHMIPTDSVQNKVQKSHNLDKKKNLNMHIFMWIQLTCKIRKSSDLRDLKWIH